MQGDGLRPEAGQKPLKVLIYSHYFWPSVGGVERAVELLAQGVVARGHAVTVVTATAAGPAATTRFPYTVIRQPGIVHLGGLIRNHDVVHLAGPALLPMVLAWLLRRPFLVEHHGYQAICPNGLLLYQPSSAICPGHFQAGRHRECLKCNAGLGWIASFRMWILGFPRRWLCQRAATNVTVTHHVLRRLGLPRSQTIYHGVPAPAFPEEPPANPSQPASPITFAFLGRFVAEKGLPVLIEAAARLHRQGLPFRLKLIGDGPQRPQIESAIRAHGLAERTLLTGMLAGEELRRATADVAAVILPSVSEETAGLAAMEQMAYGRVVIGSAIGGLSEVIGDAGLKFPAGDAAALAACMRTVIENPARLRDLRERARQRALLCFRTERRIDAYLQLYASLLTEPATEDTPIGSGSQRERRRR